MKKLSKELQRRIADGEHGALMDGIEELIDMYNNKPWEEGFNACKDDICIHSLRLAEHIKKMSVAIGHKPTKDENVRVVEVDDLAKCIEDYFNENLNA